MLRDAYRGVIVDEDQDLRMSMRLAYAGSGGPRARYPLCVSDPGGTQGRRAVLGAPGQSYTPNPVAVSTGSGGRQSRIGVSRPRNGAEGVLDGRPQRPTIHLRVGGGVFNA